MVGDPARISLPDFPWDRLTPFAGRARAHPGGLVDLSVGTPVDSPPPFVQAALAAAGDFPGYPLTAGTPALLEAARGWLVRRCGARPDVAVLPVVGTKELVGLLGWMLGGTGAVLVPELAYPTYDVGARVARMEPVREWRPDVSLVWLNSPSNPTGEVLPVERLAAELDRARSAGAVLASDECYLEFGYAGDPVSVLHPSVNGGSLDGVLAVHSLSKRSNLAGYRMGMVAGDPVLIERLLQLRRHLGLIVPGPVQHAAAAAWADDGHVAEQRERYRRRRDALGAALAAAGFRLDGGAAGLYLWASEDRSCWDSVARLADLGILVAPGEFYGPAGARHVRVALTASDERVDAAVTRLQSAP